MSNSPGNNDDERLWLVISAGGAIALIASVVLGMLAQVFAPLVGLQPGTLPEGIVFLALLGFLTLVGALPTAVVSRVWRRRGEDEE